MWLMKIETSANPRQKSMALAWRIIAISSSPAEKAQDPCEAVASKEMAKWAALDRRAPGEIAPELVRVNEAPDQRIGDGLLAGHSEAVGVAALQHEPCVVAREPACLGDLVWIDQELARLGLGDATQHERVGEWPGLARVELDLAHPDAGFLQHLAAHRVLDVLSRFNEAGQGRVPLLGEAMLVRQQTTLTIRDQHDDDRVGAREPLQTTGPALAPPASVLHQRGTAAVAAAAGVLVPLGERARLAAQRQLLRGHDPLHGKRTQVDNGAQLFDGAGYIPGSVLRHRQREIPPRRRGPLHAQEEGVADG